MKPERCDTRYDDNWHVPLRQKLGVQHAARHHHVMARFQRMRVAGK